MKAYSLKQKLITGLVLDIFLIFTIFFYGPAGAYLSNAEEFNFGFGAVLRGIGLVSIIAFAALTLISLIIPGKLFRWYLMLMTGIGMGFYVQGNLFRNNYGVMDGRDIKWSDYNSFGFLNAAIWLLLISVPFVVAFVLRKKDGKLINSVLVFMGIFITLIQAAVFGSQLIAYEQSEKESLTISEDGMFEFAPDNNIIAFVIDTIDEQYYEEFLDKHPDYENIFTGFTHYDNAMAGGARTMMAMPVFFTGIPYDRQESYKAYVKEIYKKDNLLKKMYDSGYDVRVYSEPMFYSTDTVDWVSNFSSDKNPVTSFGMLSKKLYKLSMFKLMPHFLKRFFWMDTAEFDMATAKDDNYEFDDVKFYESFKKEHFSINPSLKKTFTVYHLRGDHRPYDMDENGERDRRSNLERQNEGVFKILAELIEDLKDKNLYDSSDIMITADHGDIAECQWIMLLHKPASAEGDITYSHAPVSSFDFSVYYSGLLGLEMSDNQYGVDFTALNEDEARTRYIYRNTSDNSRLVVRKFSTDTAVGNLEALVLDSEFVEKADSKPYKLGDRLGFDVDNTGNQYAVEGFSENHGFRTKMKGPLSKLVIPLKKKPKDKLRVDIELHEHSDVSEGMLCIIRANDVEVYGSKVNRDMIMNGISFEVDPDSFEDNNLTLSFIFPELSQYEMEQDVLDRTTTLSLVSIVIDKAE